VYFPGEQALQSVGVGLDVSPPLFGPVGQAAVVLLADGSKVKVGMLPELNRPSCSPYLRIFSNRSILLTSLIGSLFCAGGFKWVVWQAKKAFQ
jgi:hypothetical protein